MSEFPVFFASLLNSFAEFLWLPGTRYLTALIVILCLISIVKKLFTIAF